MKENVILVDPNDNEIGTMEKMEAHISGQLHRAFSIFVFNADGELLLQQRALNKYHSGGKWTNTCCSHPRSNEETFFAAHRRLAEEMGMACDLQHVFNFIYKAEVENGLFEHELDHVYFAISNDKPILDSNEVADYRYISMEDLRKDIQARPELYTEWLKICLDKVMVHYEQMFKNGNIA